jgi:hypothetical protein
MKDILILALGVGVVVAYKKGREEGEKKGYEKGHEAGKLTCKCEKCDPLPTAEKENWTIQGIKHTKIYV